MEENRKPKRSNTHTKYLETLFLGIQNLYTTELSTYFSEELEEIFEDITKIYVQELPNLKRTSIIEEPKFGFRPNLELEKLKIKIFRGDIKEWDQFL